MDLEFDYDKPVLICMRQIYGKTNPNESDKQLASGQGNNYNGNRMLLMYFSTPFSRNNSK